MPRRAEFPSLIFKHEGARRSNLAGEIIVIQSEAGRLPADGGMRFKIVDHLKPVTWTRQRRQRRPFVGNLDRLSDNQRGQFRILIDHTSLTDGFDEGLAAPIAGGQFADGPPETRTMTLSMPRPASAAMQCSTVSTKSVPLRRQVRRGRRSTFSTRAGIRADLPSCSRIKVMPASGSAGAKVTVATSPEKSPGPASDASRDIVRWCSLTDPVQPAVNGFRTCRSRAV